MLHNGTQESLCIFMVMYITYGKTLSYMYSTYMQCTLCVVLNMYREDEKRYHYMELMYRYMGVSKLYFVLLGGEVVLAGNLEAVVSVQYGGHLQCSHLLDKPWQLLLG